MSSNAEFLAEEYTLLGSENVHLETQEELILFKSSERTLSSFCYAFTAAHTFSENEKMHTLPVNMGETKTFFQFINSLESSRCFNP